MCFGVCVLTCTFCCAHIKQMGKMEMKRVRQEEETRQRDLWVGSTVCAQSMKPGSTLRFGWKTQINRSYMAGGVIPS